MAAEILHWMTSEDFVIKDVQGLVGGDLKRNCKVLDVGGESVTTSWTPGLSKSRCRALLLQRSRMRFLLGGVQ